MLFAAFSSLHQRNGSYNSVNLLAKFHLAVCIQVKVVNVICHSQILDYPVVR